MRVFITGTAGFIGYHLADLLLAQGARVQGYDGMTDYYDEDGVFTGRIAGIRDRLGFHADTVDRLREAFHEEVEDYLETCARIGKAAQKTYSVPGQP